MMRLKCFSNDNDPLVIANNLILLKDGEMILGIDFTCLVETNEFYTKIRTSNIAFGASRGFALFFEGIMKFLWFKTCIFHGPLNNRLLCY